MFSLDHWQEIYDTVTKNKLRTALTGFSIAWGIFMLIMLLGSGQGLRNGIIHQFRDGAINSIWIRAGQTSMPHAVMKSGRKIQFKDADFEYIKLHVKGIEHITARFNRWSQSVSYKDKAVSFPVRAVHPATSPEAQKNWYPDQPTRIEPEDGSVELLHRIRFRAFARPASRCLALCSSLYSRHPATMVLVALMTIGPSRCRQCLRRGNTLLTSVSRETPPKAAMEDGFARPPERGSQAGSFSSAQNSRSNAPRGFSAPSICRYSLETSRNCRA